MRVRARVCNLNDPKQETWFETFDSPDLKTDDPEDRSMAVNRVKDMINRYNETLRPKEQARKLKGLKVLGKSTEHLWHKVNLVTIMDRHGHAYDQGQCEKCGTVGKRYGLSGTFVPSKVKERTCNKGI